MLQTTCEIQPITFDLFERVCLALTLDPDKVLLARQRLKKAQLAVSGLRFLDLVLTSPPGVSEADAQSIAGALVPEFFLEAHRQQSRASNRARHYSKRMGIDGILGQKKPAISVARALSRLSPAEETHMRRELDLEEMLFRLAIRGIDETARNVKKYLQ